MKSFDRKRLSVTSYKNYDNFGMEISKFGYSGGPLILCTLIL